MALNPIAQNLMTISFIEATDQRPSLAQKIVDPLLALLKSGSIKSTSSEISILKGLQSRLQNLRCEKSNTILGQELLELAKTYLHSPTFQALSLSILKSLKNFSLPQAQAASNLLDIIQGRNGHLSDRIVEQVRQLTQTNTWVPMVTAMGLGSLMNPLGTRLVAHLLKGRINPISGLLLSRAGGMSLDALTFTGAQHGIAYAAGQSLGSFSHDLLHGGLMLTSLRLGQTLARNFTLGKSIQSMMRSLGHTTKNSVEIGIPLIAEYFAIQTAGHLAPYFIPGPTRSYSSLETLATMVHFRMAQSILSSFPSYLNRHRQLVLETQSTLTQLNRVWTAHYKNMGSHFFGSGSLQSLSGFAWAREGMMGKHAISLSQNKWKENLYFHQAQANTSHNSSRRDQVLPFLKNIRGKVIRWDHEREMGVIGMDYNQTGLISWKPSLAQNWAGQIMQIPIKELTQDPGARCLILFASNKHWKTIEGFLNQNRF